MKQLMIFSLLVFMTTQLTFAAQDKSEGETEDTICLAMNQDEVILKGLSATAVSPSQVEVGASKQ